MFLHRTIKDFIEDELKGNRKCESYFAKLNKTLRIYAELLELPEGEVRVVDVVNEAFLNNSVYEKSEKELNSRFLDFLSGLKLKKNSKDSLETGMKTIILSILAEQNLPNIVLDAADFTKDIFILLPREGATRHISDDGRLRLPLTDLGRNLLSVMTEIIDKFAVKGVKRLFVDHSLDILQKIRADYSRHKAITLIDTFYTLRKELIKKGSLPPSEKAVKKGLPPKIQEQVNQFLKVQNEGVSKHPELRNNAARNGIEFKEKLEKKTIENYIKHSSVGIGKMNIEDDVFDSIELRDLMTLKTRIIEIEGRDHEEKFNPLVDEYREIERKRETKAKAKDYDSGSFKLFIVSVKMIAAYNSIFMLGKLFGEAYKNLVLDKATRVGRKQEKKKVYDSEWIDSEIIRLLEDFRTIVKDQSYTIDKSKRTKKQSNENMSKCLFLLNMMCLRFMGYRQQLIRQCEVGEQIIFRNNGEICFSWDKTVTKNDIDYEFILNPKRDMETFGLVFEILNIYKKKLYPYILKNAGADLEGQFFVRVRHNKFYRHEKEDAVSFSGLFIRNANKFLNFGGRENLTSEPLHPHFFRGFCTDSLIDKKVSIEAVAQLIGDSPDVVKLHYQDKDRSYSSEAALNQLALLADEKKKLDRIASGEDDKEVTNLKAENLTLQNKLKEQEEKTDKRHKEMMEQFERQQKMYEEMKEFFESK